MKAERNALDAQRKAEAAEARKALAEIDYLQVILDLLQLPRSISALQLAFSLSGNILCLHFVLMSLSCLLTVQVQLANAQEEMLAGDTGRTASGLRDARTQVCSADTTAVMYPHLLRVMMAR